eukprot:GHVH01017028.1.p1 GENE.GHVH01017028.1~~GHVH01017028.1.p1  ORF type:complete len:170 (-),score=12.39 GHVH01017028.1:139-648(-)
MPSRTIFSRHVVGAEELATIGIAPPTRDSTSSSSTTTSIVNKRVVSSSDSCQQSVARSLGMLNYILQKKSRIHCSSDKVFTMYCDRFGYPFNYTHYVSLIHDMSRSLRFGPPSNRSLSAVYSRVYGQPEGYSKEEFRAVYQKLLTYLKGQFAVAMQDSYCELDRMAFLR